MQNEPIMFLC